MVLLSVCASNGKMHGTRIPNYVVSSKARAERPTNTFQLYERFVNWQMPPVICYVIMACFASSDTRRRFHFVSSVLTPVFFSLRLVSFDVTLYLVFIIHGRIIVARKLTGKNSKFSLSVGTRFKWGLRC